MSAIARPLPGRMKSARPSRDSADAALGTLPPSARVQLEGWEPGALILIVGLTFCFGLVELYSASALMAREEGQPSYFYALRQFLGLGPGILIAALLSRVSYQRLWSLAWPLLLLLVGCLIVMIMPGTEALAPRVNGARRWIDVGVAFQPSELAKLALIIWTAALAVKKQDKLHSLRKGLLPFLVVWLAVALPVLLQPNFSAALLLMLLAALVLFAGGARIGHFILIGLVLLPLALMQAQSADYRARRITAFLNPTEDTGGLSYQINQSLIAVGSGGLTGVGFGDSRQKFGFLPEPHNDFLFAMIAEEWGFIGVAFTLSLFLAFALVGYRIARSSNDLFGYLLGIGMTNLIVVSALLHMGVGLALLPTTGVILPFMSYGRSGLLVCFAAVGVLLSIARLSMPPAKS